MKFVFDLDGTLSFDYMTIDEEIKQVLLTAPQFGHEVLFASALLSRLSGTIRFGIESADSDWPEWRSSLSEWTADV